MQRETDQEARIRLYSHAARAFEQALEQDRMEREARARRANATWANICFDRPELRALLTSTSARPAVVNRRLSGAPWIVMERHSNGRWQQHRVAGGSESDARALAERLRADSTSGTFEAIQMGGGQAGRTTTR